jgi:uncharacterized membrane protein YciS (DUF1049 family)
METTGLSKGFQPLVIGEGLGMFGISDLIQVFIALIMLGALIVAYFHLKKMNEQLKHNNEQL